MSHPHLRGRTALAVAVVAILSAVSAHGVAAASSTTFSGQATVISGTVAGQNISIVNAGPLPAAGGASHNCLLAYPSDSDCQLQPAGDVTNGAVSVELLSARTAGQGSHSHSSASTADVSVDLTKLLGIPGLPVISASALSAEANAVCQAGVATASGTAEFVDAAGVVVTPPPLVINIPMVGTVTVLYDQVTPTQSGNTAAVDVRTLEIIAPFANTDLTIGYAHADITCATSNGNQAGCSDKITGGGWYDLTGRDHFALAASAGDQTWGHLLYDDKKAGLKFHGRPDFAYLVGAGNGIASPSYASPLDVSVGQGAAVVSGTNEKAFTLNGTTYAPFSTRFVAVAIDNGEGHSAPGDAFAIVLLVSNNPIYTSNATASGGLLTSLLGTRLGGGNIQYHGCH